VSVQEVVGEGLGERVFALIADHLGGAATVQMSRTQISFVRSRGFAYLWTPRRWQGASAAPLVLTIVLHEVDSSPRWKEVYKVRPNLWNHHLEIHEVMEVDGEVLAWVDRAWEQAA
jgi:hypothetical protein